MIAARASVQMPLVAISLGHFRQIAINKQLRRLISFLCDWFSRLLHSGPLSDTLLNPPSVFNAFQPLGKRERAKNFPR